MARELTEKQENFCQNYILNGRNAAQAYRDSYDTESWLDSSIYTEASKMLDNPVILQRIKELQERSVKKKFDVSLEYIVEELLDVIMSMEEESEKEHKKIPAKKLKKETLMDLAKLKGLIVDKKEDVTDYSKLLDKIKSAK
jgi:phage terminase small subunit